MPLYANVSPEVLLVLRAVRSGDAADAVAEGKAGDAPAVEPVPASSHVNATPPPAPETRLRGHMAETAIAASLPADHGLQRVAMPMGVAAESGGGPDCDTLIYSVTMPSQAKGTTEVAMPYPFAVFSVVIDGARPGVAQLELWLRHGTLHPREFPAAGGPGASVRLVNAHWLH